MFFLVEVIESPPVTGGEGKVLLTPVIMSPLHKVEEITHVEMVISVRHFAYFQFENRWTNFDGI
jgi:hypothetical protein